MPEHFRALVIIIVLALAAFAFAKRLFANIIDAATLNRWRNLWFALTFAAFLSHSFWLYAALAAFVVMITAGHENNRVALFFAALFAVPAVELQIPGLGLINYLFSLSHVRILALTLLLPAFLQLRSIQTTTAFGRLPADKILLGYMLLIVILQLRGTTLTDTLRQGFYIFTDIFLPYYVISRSLKTLAMFRQAIAAFVLSGMLLAILAIFESLRHWNLYSAVVTAMDPGMGFGSYLGRAGSLRASVSTGHSIALGYTLAVATGLYLFLQPAVADKLHRRLGMAGLLGGLFAALSRGPWVGAAIVIVTFIATGRTAVKRLLLLALAGILALPIVAIIPSGKKVLDLLPFIGSVDKGNITYREQLIDNAIIVIQRNPWFGSIDYRSTPEMEAMRQGQGIIDIVNTYIGVALNHGLVGLCLFIGFFLAVLLGIRKAMRLIRDPEDEMHRLGRALFATLIGILVIIFTVSSITIIPVVYWSVAGLGVAYVQMVRERMKTANG